VVPKVLQAHNQDQPLVVLVTDLALRPLLVLNQDQVHSLTRVALKVHLVRN